MTVSYTAPPRCRRASAATSADRFVRASYIVSTMPSSVEARVQVVANEVDGGEQLGQALKRVVLTLERDEDRIGGGQGIHGQQTE